MKNHKQLCADMLGHIHISQIKNLSYEEIEEPLLELAFAIAHKEIRFPDLEEIDDFDIDYRYLLRRYFDQYPSVKFEQMLQELTGFDGQCWLEAISC